MARRITPIKRRGFTLLEALAATVVLAILVLGVCMALSEAYQQGQVVRANGTGVTLARQLADEISSKPLADPATGSEALGPDTGMTSRSQFTHVTNYAGYSDTSTALPTLEGTTLDATGADVYRRSVVVTVGAKPSSDTASPETDFAIVTVTVACPGGQSVAVSQCIANVPVQR